MADQDVLDADMQEPNNHRPLINENPYVFGAIISSVTTFLASYGWILLLGTVFVMVLWTNIKEHIFKFFGHRKRAYDVTDSMTPEQIEARAIAMEKARMRMQEKYEAESRARKEKQKELEEQKRAQMISDHDAMKSGKSQSSTLHRIEIKTADTAPPTTFKSSKDRKSLRKDDYNPLMGDSSGSTRYRPSGRPTSGG